MALPEFARGNLSLGEVTAGLEQAGYREQVVALEGGEVRIASTRATLPAGDVAVERVYRLEGASDPGDLMLVAAVALPGDDKGTLVLHYGPTASAADQDVLSALTLPAG
jgi:hypothetical protein